LLLGRYDMAEIEEGDGRELLVEQRTDGVRSVDGESLRGKRYDSDVDAVASNVAGAGGERRRLREGETIWRQRRTPIINGLARWVKFLI
jgi:hypothetical protein